MDASGNRYWPFDVVPVERRTDQQIREIDFLQSAFRAGYEPYLFGSQNFGASAGKRGGIILYRGLRGKHWEMQLGTADAVLLSAHVDAFECAAEAVLLWLGGAMVADVVEYIRAHLFSTAAVPTGLVLHGPDE
jgi:hypothetical protein